MPELNKKIKPEVKFEDFIEDVNDKIPAGHTKTINGKIIKTEDGVWLKEGYFIEKNHPNVVYDIFDNKPFLKDHANVAYTEFKEGVLNTKKPSYCYQNYLATLIDATGTAYNVLKESIPEEYYIEDLNDGRFYWKGIHDKFKRNKPVIYRKVKNSYSQPTGNLQFDYMMGLKSSTYRLTEGKRYTFGIELETINGFLPHHLDRVLNYDAVHDGSLRPEDKSDPVGGEYVSGVLRGDMGFAQAKRLCNELTKRCKVNKLCGMHAHFGELAFTKENLILIYKAYYLLEEEIFTMLPSARANNEYCRKLPTLKSCLESMKQEDVSKSYERELFVSIAYEELYRFVASQNSGPSFDSNKKTQHPLGNKCGYNHSSSRYCWINFVPAMFNTRGNDKIKTFEVRNHSGTTDYRKVKNWVLLHMGILAYVENFQSELLTRHELSLNEIITRMYPKRASLILQYVEERKTKFIDRSKNAAVAAELSDYEEIVEDESLTLKSL